MMSWMRRRWRWCVIEIIVVKFALNLAYFVHVESVALSEVWFLVSRVEFDCYRRRNAWIKSLWKYDGVPSFLYIKYCFNDLCFAGGCCCCIFLLLEAKTSWNSEWIDWPEFKVTLDAFSSHLPIVVLLLAHNNQDKIHIVMQIRKIQKIQWHSQHFLAFLEGPPTLFFHAT